MDKRLEQVALTMRKIQIAIEGVDYQISQIEELGYVKATEWWKGGKYLYLVHPQRNGQRVREYIGADPEAVEAARQRVKRFGLRGQLLTKKRQLERIQSSMEASLDSLMHAATQAGRML